MSQINAAYLTGLAPFCSWEKAGASAATNRPNPTVFVAPQTHRLGVLVVPVDKGAEALQVKLEADILEALAGHPDVQTTDTLFGLPVEAEAEAALARAELAFTESRGAFESRDHDRAERLLRANIQQFTKAAGAESAGIAWKIEMHQFRIEPSPRESGKPTPEGMHRDGVDWVFVGLIARTGVAGGVTGIGDAARTANSSLRAISGIAW